MSIAEIIANTHCPFAKIANLSEPIFIHSLEIQHEIKKHKQKIKHYFQNAQKSNSDALCIIFTCPQFGSTIENLSFYTREFFMALASEFGEFKLPGDIIDLNEKCWPSIENERFFMVSFAACYPNTSPRFNHGDPYTFFFLQPVSSFERHAKDRNAIQDDIRQKIQNLFAKNNQPYDGNISNLKNELVKMVAPMQLGDPIIQWWKSI